MFYLKSSYQHESVEIYAVSSAANKWILVDSLPMETIEGAGGDEPIILATLVNPTSDLPITIYRLETGEIQIVTYYASGKPYIFRWHPSQPYDGDHVAW